MPEPTVRILLIEDDEVDRLACKRGLGGTPRYRCTFLEAATGREGLRLAREEHPDCVLLDYRLPDLDGLEVLAGLASGLASAQGEAELPVVMLTGANEVSVAVEAMRCGARDYLVKDTERGYLALLPTVIDRVLEEDRVRAERREAEARLQTIADAMPGLLAYVDAEGRYRFNNARYSEWFGLSQDALYGRSMDALLGPEALETARTHTEGALAGAPQAFENVVATTDGPRNLFVRFQPHLNEHGQADGFYVAAFDITERRAAEDEAWRYQQEIERLYRQYALGAMAAVFAHELNQPLAAIGSYVGASARLLRADGDTSELLHYLDQSAQQVRRAAEIVRRVRSLLRRGELETAAEDLNHLVERIITQVVTDAAHEDPVEVTFERGDVPQVSIERAAVEKVLANLVQNACEAIRDGGPHDGRVTVRTFPGEEGFVQVSVADTGPGLGEDDPTERVFEPFYTTKPEGLGLGLPISRTIIEAQGGRLWGEAGDPGAVFHFTVPVARR